MAGSDQIAGEHREIRGLRRSGIPAAFKLDGCSEVS